MMEDSRVDFGENNIDFFRKWYIWKKIFYYSIFILSRMEKISERLVVLLKIIRNVG